MKGKFFNSFAYMAIVTVALILMTNVSLADEDVKCKWDEDVKHWDGTQRELNACAGERLSHRNEEMKKLYDEQMSYLKLEDSRSQLKASQQAWLAYRKEACLYESWPANGGTIDPMLEALCMAEITSQRIQTLNKYLLCRENGCPD